MLRTLYENTTSIIVGGSVIAASLLGYVSCSDKNISGRVSNEYLGTRSTSGYSFTLTPEEASPIRFRINGNIETLDNLASELKDGDFVKIKKPSTINRDPKDMVIIDASDVEKLSAF